MSYDAQAPERRGLLIILSSASGTGKTTLARKLTEWDPTIRFSISATTRPPRPGETHGQEYFFTDRAGFEAMVAADDMLEYAEVFGHLYGSPKGPAAKAVAMGHDVIFDIDWQGGQQIRSSNLARDVVSIFLLPPSIMELETRLHTRGQDTPEVIVKRMAQSQAEISHWAEYDYVLVNDTLEKSFESLKTILSAERLRRDRQPQLADRVRALNLEFMQRNT